MDLTTLTSPTLLIDEHRCRANISAMAERARRHNLQLAPHFKTHQSAQIGEWAREAGVEAITVTSLRMARYFADHDWTDITIAMPLNVRELPGLLDLAQRVHLTVFINSETTTKAVMKALADTDVALNFYIEIDAGYGRSGVRYDDRETIDRILRATVSTGSLDFVGFYTHSGHTYNTSNSDEILGIHSEAFSRLGGLRDVFASAYPDHHISLGDTPSCSIAEDFTGVSVIRPGNFFYYDLTQMKLGVCTREQIAVCLACPVLEVHPVRGEAIVHGGWVQLGKDSLPDEHGQPFYGEVVRLDAAGWTKVGPASSGGRVDGGGAPGRKPDVSRVQSVSQEHGTVRLPPVVLGDLRVGDLLGILPIHACATADAMRKMSTLSGEAVAMMKG